MYCSFQCRLRWRYCTLVRFSLTQSSCLWLDLFPSPHLELNSPKLVVICADFTTSATTQGDSHFPCTNKPSIWEWIWVSRSIALSYLVANVAGIPFWLDVWPWCYVAHVTKAWLHNCVFNFCKLRICQQRLRSGILHRIKHSPLQQWAVDRQKAILVKERIKLSIHNIRSVIGMLSFLVKAVCCLFIQG